MIILVGYESIWNNKYISVLILFFCFLELRDDLLISETFIGRDCLPNLRQLWSWCYLAPESLKVSCCSGSETYISQSGMHNPGLKGRPHSICCPIFPLPIYFTYDDVSFHVTLSIHLTLSFLPVSISLFSMSVSPLLPCK